MKWNVDMNEYGRLVKALYIITPPLGTIGTLGFSDEVYSLLPLRYPDIHRIIALHRGVLGSLTR